MHRHYRSSVKRGLFSFALISLVMTIGTLGMHWIEKLSFLNAFYFITMLATSQGPPSRQ